MAIHKRSQLTPLQPEEIYCVYPGEGKKIQDNRSCIIQYQVRQVVEIHWLIVRKF